jgi:hypothetical protein
MFSGLVSHVVSAKFHYPRLINQLASSISVVNKPDTWAAVVAASSGSARAAAIRKVPEILPSLGASGAIYGAVTLTALAFPEAQVSLFIPPSYPISIQWGVGGMLLLDTIGILRGWRYVRTLLSLCSTYMMSVIQVIRPLGPSWGCCVRGSILRVRSCVLAACETDVSRIRDVTLYRTSYLIIPKHPSSFTTHLPLASITA